MSLQITIIRGTLIASFNKRKNRLGIIPIKQQAVSNLGYLPVA